MNSQEEFDPLADMLDGKEISPSDAVRDAAFAPTRNVLRRRRVMRRARVVVALAGCYLAGVASVGWRQTPTEPKQKVIASLEEDLAIIAASGVQTHVPKTKFERLRAEADRTWEQTHDMDAALRLYARAIKFATPKELEISPDQDNFILTTLKEARLRETHYAFNDDNS